MVVLYRYDDLPSVSRQDCRPAFDDMLDICSDVEARHGAFHGSVEASGKRNVSDGQPCRTPQLRPPRGAEQGVGRPQGICTSRQPRQGRGEE